MQRSRAAALGAALSRGDERGTSSALGLSHGWGCLGSGDEQHERLDSQARVCLKAERIPTPPPPLRRRRRSVPLSAHLLTCSEFGFEFWTAGRAPRSR